VEIHRQLTLAKPGQPGSVVTIGAYDGVHRGHCQVISEVCSIAVERGLRSVVVTFDRHPASIVRPDSAPLLLTDLDQKLEHLAATGIDEAFVVPFDQKRAEESAEEFVESVLVECLAVRAIVVGEDFHFGYQRAGNVSLLRALGNRIGFEVLGLDLVGLDGKPVRDHEQVSSTFIRRALVGGDLGRANAMLGRPFELRGEVGRGDRRGTEIGFPTANIQVSPALLLPGDGVYAGWVERSDGSVHASAISIGTRPHFYDNGKLLLEAHLLNFEDDLYGEVLRVRFVARLRSQQSFESLGKLVSQLSQDVDDARRVLS